MNKDQIISTIKVVTIALMLTVGIQYVAAQAVTTWSPPTAPPPGGNTYAPLNVSSAGQTKAGGLMLGYGLPVTDNGLLIPTGMAGLGTSLPDVSTKARLTVGQLRSATPGINAAVSFQSLPDTDPSRYYHNMRIGSDDSLNFDSFSGTWGNTLSLKTNHQIAIPGGSPTAGKVLTATDASGLAAWKTAKIVYSNCTAHDVSAGGGGIADYGGVTYVTGTGEDRNNWLCGANKVVKDISTNAGDFGSHDYVMCCTETIVMQ